MLSCVYIIGDIWKQTLSFYLYDEEQPLPQDDEVLTCSEETTLEHVCLFIYFSMIPLSV